MGIWRKFFGSDELTTVKVSQVTHSEPANESQREQPSSNPSRNNMAEKTTGGAKVASESGADCPADLVVLVDTLFAANSDKQRRESAEKQLKEHPKRATAVAPLTKKFREDRNESVHHVCNALEAIGTPDNSFELLLEMFRTTRKKKVPFDEWGNLRVESWGPDEDHATGPSYLLVCKIENGPNRLKKCLSSAEYEEVVARAHAWNMSDRPLLTQALAEIGSKLAVLRLLHDINQTHSSQENRTPAVRALGSIGRRFLPLLIEKLESRSQDRKTQTTYLRDILSVLELCGDRTCVDAIIQVSRQDGTIEENARRATTAIAARDGSLKISEALGTQPFPVRRLAPSGDSYVDRCFDCDWTELDEPRIWSDYPELKSVADLANGGQDAAALAQLAKVWTKYRDHDFLYGWKAMILAKQGNKPDAIGVLNDGVLVCRKKFRLCKTRAQIEYNAGDLNEAVVWWIKSAVSQISAQGPAIEDPFLYLAYVAGALGDRTSKDRLLKIVDRLTRLGRLNDSAINRINSLVAAKGNRAMSVAIGRLCVEFL